MYVVSSESSVVLKNKNRVKREKMAGQSEHQLEQALLQQLNGLGYHFVQIKDEAQLIANLKLQIERINDLAPLSATEWAQVFSYLYKGSVFDRAKNLRDLCHVKFDNGTDKNIAFLHADATKNYFQVTNQITIDHRDFNGRTSRFDVTILVNGLPLVQIELKRRGMEIAEAFHQTLRYGREAYWSGQGLFSFIQLFVISNGANTRYYSNGTKQIEFIFPWASEDNKHINELVDFTDAFLSQVHLTEMLNQYIVMIETTKTLMVLRPYQIYAVKNIVKQVTTTNNNGYIWHTTGSGKTLTSFKASQIIMNLPDVDKVMFVVDRKDLDTQTANEFNSFKENSVDSTKNTKVLVNQLAQPDSKLIVTTLQKLNRAITSDRYLDDVVYLKDKKVVFIFDECHRSQFGETHRNIKKFFSKAQMFGFTGTPIFEDNGLTKSGLKLTTKYLFGECLHQYVIVDAIRDRNVLQFQIDYRGRYTLKGMDSNDNQEVQGIDTKELLDNPDRLEMITRFIVDNHGTKTRNGEFTAMFCVSSVDVLTQYYDLFEKVQAEKLKESESLGKLYTPITVATIFSYGANEAVDTSDEQEGIIDEESPDVPSKINQSHRDKLDHCIANYNEQFGTNYNSGDQFYAYYQDIASRVKRKEIDILLVVNMFLTGFDSKPLNTLYVDKNLKFHGLIQAFSRTNRVLNDKKPFGNIICFRNLKQATDDALSLFSNKQVKDIVLVPSFEKTKEAYEAAVAILLAIVPDYKSVDDLQTEDEQLEFIKAFREVMRCNAQLATFIEYNQDETTLTKLEFSNYASKYSDLCNEIKQTTEKEKTSVLKDVDFQLDLLRSDRVNVAYILQLLQSAINSDDEEKRQVYKAQVYDLIGSEISLHNKQDLIQQFIEENMRNMAEGQDVKEAFDAYWEAERKKAAEQLCKEENLKPDAVKTILDRYQFTKRLPRREEISALPNYKVGLFDRENVFTGLLNKTKQFIDRFYVGL